MPLDECDQSISAWQFIVAKLDMEMKRLQQRITLLEVSYYDYASFSLHYHPLHLRH
jgi:hypothetical protein